MSMVEPYNTGSLMKKTISFIAVAAAVVFSSCSKSETPSSTLHTLSADAMIENGTKTVYSDNGAGAGMKVDWAESESFAAYYDGSTEPITFSKSEAGTAFSATDVPEGVTATTPFKGLYGSAAKLNSNGKISVDFSKQNGTLESLAAYDIMTADSEVKDDVLRFAFKHKCVILRVKIRNEYTEADERVKKLKLMFENAVFDESFAEGCIYKNPYYNVCSLSISVDVAPQETKIFYIAIPAMTYRKSNYSSIGFGETGTVEKNIVLSEKKSAIEAGKIYDISVVYKEVEFD